MVRFTKRRILDLTDLKVSIGNITFNNPIWVASGTFGYGTEAPELIDVNKLGAIVTKSITRQPREGNPPPRIVETPSGMINSIGLANIGVEKYIKEMLPIYEDLSTKIIMNMGSTRTTGSGDFVPEELMVARSFSELPVDFDFEKYTSDMPPLFNKTSHTIRHHTLV